MSKRPKVHWSEGRRPGDILWVTLCGQLVADTAATPEAVTCRVCQKKLAKMGDPVEQYVESKFEPRPLTEYRNPYELAGPQPIIDPVSGMPFVSRFTWPAIRTWSHRSPARWHWCGHCFVCSWMSQVEADAAARPWVKKHHVGTEHRWASVSHALEWFAQVRLDGYDMGTLGEALDKLGRLGTKISVHGTQGQQKAFEQAQDAIIVEQALNQCYRRRSKHRVSRRARLYCLFENAVHGIKPHVLARRVMAAEPKVQGLTGPKVAVIVRNGRWTVYEHLRKHDMIPPR